jgi:hypothetical protein
MAMAKGCLLWLLQFAALVGLYYLALHGRLAPPQDLYFSLVGGFVVALAIGAFRNFFMQRRNSALLRQALARELFEDGQLAAATGPIVALDEQPIQSPFGQRPCVLYSYEITHESNRKGGRRQSIKDFSGLGQVPCAVETPGGRVLVGGVLMLGADETLSKPQVYARAEDYLQSAPFEKIGITKIGSLMDVLLTQVEGPIRKDWRNAGDDFRLDPGTHRIQETIVREGETVTVVGLYKAELGGIVPGAEGLKLIRGGSKEAEESFGEARLQYLMIGIVLPLLYHFFLFIGFVVQE